MIDYKKKHLAQVLVCLFLVYISWGSGFIAIRFALEGFPAFFLCGIRMMAAGVLLYVLTWLRGERNNPTRVDLKQLNILAFFMVLISSGFLVKGQESVASGTAAMVLGSVPVWMVLGGWLFMKEPRPSATQFLGLGGGFVGLLLLCWDQGTGGQQSLVGLGIVLLAALGWVVGSFYSKAHAGETKLSVMRNSGVLMFLGGLQSMLVSLGLNEWQEFSFAAVPMQSWIALGYLIFMGAIIAYTCYFWLLLHTRTIVAISYEFVNPVIGVFLGWILAGETVNGTIVLACLLMVGSVFLAVSSNERN